MFYGFSFSAVFSYFTFCASLFHFFCGMLFVCLCVCFCFEFFLCLTFRTHSFQEYKIMIFSFKKSFVNIVCTKFIDFFLKIMCIWIFLINFPFIYFFFWTSSHILGISGEHVIKLLEGIFIINFFFTSFYFVWVHRLSDFSLRTDIFGILNFSKRI